MKLVYIASPLRGAVEENIKKANEYCRQVAESGAIPIAPHSYFSNFLRDGISQERQLGMDMGLDMLARCDELLICGDKISEGMAQEIKEAHRLHIPIKCMTAQIEELYQDIVFNCLDSETVGLTQGLS